MIVSNLRGFGAETGPVYGPEYRPDLMDDDRPVYGPEYRPDLMAKQKEEEALQKRSMWLMGGFFALTLYLSMRKR